MSLANEYRAKGEGCLRRAAETNDPEAASLFRELAADYFALAGADPLTARGSARAAGPPAIV